MEQQQWSPLLADTLEIRTLMPEEELLSVPPESRQPLTLFMSSIMIINRFRHTHTFCNRCHDHCINYNTRIHLLCEHKQCDACSVPVMHIDTSKHEIFNLYKIIVHLHRTFSSSTTRGCPCPSLAANAATVA